MNTNIAFIIFSSLFTFSFISETQASVNKSKNFDKSLVIKEITINEFYSHNFLIGNAEDKQAGTGYTVFILKKVLQLVKVLMEVGQLQGNLNY